MKISGLVITFNEEENIAACLRSMFRVCDEVIVVDSNSTDRTIEVAKQEGAKVYCQDFLGDGPQRSFGLQFCKNDWVLNLDQDEMLAEDSVEIISGLDLDDPLYEAYEFRRKNFLHDRWIRVAGLYPDYVKRLFNRKLTDFSQLKTHCRVMSKKSSKINGHILHHSFKGYQDMIRILNLYSDWQAQTLFEEGKKVLSVAPAFHGMWSFFMHYVVKRGFMAGLDGLTISLLNAMGSYFKYAKLLELNRYGS